MNTQNGTTDADNAGVMDMDMAAVKAVLPHRYPMLMVDYVRVHPATRRAEGWKCVSAGEPVFQGHFPGHPVMPGVLILDAMLQTCGVMLHKVLAPDVRQPMISAVRKVKFRRPIIPGDLLYMNVRTLAVRPQAVSFAADATVNGQAACQAEFTVSLQTMLPPAAVPAPPSDPAAVPLLDINGILDIIPHRYPLLLVDTILKIEGDTLYALKSVSGNEPFFQGHFPERPVMPGSLLIESMAQAGAVYILRQPQHRGKLIFFMGVDRARFRRPVQPGCRLMITARLCSLRSRAGRAVGEIRVNGETVVDAELSFAIVDRSRQDV